MNNQQTYQTSNINNNINFPNATAVLIHVDDEAATTAAPGAASAEQKHHPNGSFLSAGDISGDVYASARVVDKSFSDQLPIESQVDAVPLDPWSRERTTSTEESRRTKGQAAVTTATNQDSSRTTTATRRPTNTNIPSAMLEDPRHKKLRRRRRREARMVASGTTGFIIGTLFLGPIGGILVGATSAGITKSASKLAERRKDKRVMRQFQKMQGQNMVTQGHQII